MFKRLFSKKKIKKPEPPTEKQKKLASKSKIEKQILLNNFQIDSWENEIKMLFAEARTFKMKNKKEEAKKNILKIRYLRKKVQKRTNYNVILMNRINDIDRIDSDLDMGAILKESVSLVIFFNFE